MEGLFKFDQAQDCGGCCRGKIVLKFCFAIGGEEQKSPVTVDLVMGAKALGTELKGTF